MEGPYDADMNDSDGDQAPTEAEADMSNLDRHTPLAGIRLVARARGGHFY